ncbi:CYIR protein, partial [Plasmodium cynomolgi strain B]
MSFQCPHLNKENSKKNEFYIKCGTEIFKPFLPNFYSVKNEYLNYIKEINDPILRHISIYFVQYYIDGYHYYGESHHTYRSEACKYLNRWLQEKKDLFTYGEQCQTKMNLWESKFKNLWDMLKNEYTIPNTNEKKPWCDKINLSLTTKYPHELTSLNCVESISQESSSSDPRPQQVITDCECTETVVPISLAQQNHVPEMDRTKNIVATSGFTAFGTIGTLLLLYK